MGCGRRRIFFVRGGGGHELKLCWWGQNINYVPRRGESKIKYQVFFSWAGVIVCSKNNTHEYVHFSRHVSVKKKFHYFIYWFVEIAAHLIVPFYFI